MKIQEEEENSNLKNSTANKNPSNVKTMDMNISKDKNNSMKVLN